MSRRLRGEAWALVAILALGAALRLYAIGRHGLWQDEIGSVFHARAPGSLLDPLSGHAPLYYLALGAWLDLGQHVPGGQAEGSEGWVRSLSAVFGLLLVVAVHRAARSDFGPDLALLAAFFAAASPVLVWASREARAYSLLNLCVFAAWRAALRAQASGRLLHWTAYSVAATAALYTHYYAPFLLVAVAAAWLVTARPRGVAGMLPFVVATLVAVAAFAPWLPLMLRGQQGLETLFWEIRGDATRNTFPLKTFLVLLGRSDPAHAFGAMLEALVPGRFTWASLLVLAPMLGAAWRWGRRERRTRRLLAWGALAVVPLLLVLVASQWKALLVGSRYVTLASACLSAIGAAAAALLGGRRAAAVVGCFGAASLLAVQPLYRVPPSEIREATRYLDGHSAPGDCVGVVSNKAFCYTYYARQPRPVYDLPWEVPAVGRRVERSSSLHDRGVRPEDVPAIASFFSACRTTWILYNEETSWGVDMGASVLRRGLLGSGFRILEERRFTDTRLEAYVPAGAGTGGPHPR